MTASTSEPAAEPVRRSRTLLPLDLLRGFLIGMAELVPGVSGGTVALVTGVYDELIDSASHVIGAARQGVAGRRAALRTELARTDWWLVLPVLVGMAAAVLTVAGVMESFVSDHPEHARGLFFGLVLVSILVPIRMLPEASRPRWVDALLVVAVAVAAFVVVGLAGSGATSDPPLVLVALAASVAICALVLPGVSGSFFLLTVGLYTTTLDAVDSRDLVYVGVFAVGAIGGLVVFVPVLRHLLHAHRRTTLLVLGDGRNNAKDPNLAAFEEITRRVRETVWLTPEPRYSWGLGSCDLPAYAEFCDRVRVVADLSGLERAAHDFVAEAVGR